MTNFKKAIELLFQLEFNNAKNFLHKNKTEKDFTVAGIYKYAHPDWIGWETVKRTIDAHGGNVEHASQDLYYNEPFRSQVNLFIKKEFWDKMKLDKIDSQIICNEIFLFGYNAGKRTAIRKAQKIVGVTVDGYIGMQTINALNNYDPSRFSMEFDELELQYYADLILQKPSFAIYRNGWVNRANFA